MESDVELLNRLRHGDEEAFVMLVGRYQQPLYRLAHSMVSNYALAEDVVQDTWLGVVRGVDRFEGRSSLKTWLFRILANRAHAVGAKEPRHVPVDALHSVDPSRFDPQGQWADPVAPWTEATEDRLDAARWSPILMAALDDLPARQRLVVTLRDAEGMTSDEVCSILDISPDNQRVLLHRGRSRLREIVDARMKKA